jgi:hypothetical protein
MQRKRLFVSFDYDNDADLKMLFVNQSKLPDAPFDIVDASVKDHLTGDWKAKVRERIRRSDIVCVLCTTTTHTAKGVAVELQIAKELNKPYFLLWGYKDKACRTPTSASPGEKIYTWEWDVLKRLIHGDR